MEVETFDVVQFKMNSHQQNKQLLSSSITAGDERVKQLEIDLKVLDDAKSILTLLKNHKMESKKDFILKTINTALDDVYDQNLRIDIEASSSATSGKINMKYDIVLYQNDIEMARNEKLLGNNGGGVLTLISILFKILVGYIYSDNKFFLFDESISQVSPSYRPRLAQFLNEFCEQYGFTIVLISQTDDIDDYATVGYLLDGEFDKDGVPLLKIEKIFGTYPEDKYNYVKIENFQSIKKLEFRYKGLTIIRGDNNIGKSASFRAVNALLFNSFDAKDHPRKKRPRGEETKILFGKEDSESDIENNMIGLSFKTNKVVYEFDGLTFAGKSLAFDKIKEKVESIGFRYVNLKETYKNFKGNLKEQTERLATTTQYDGFYLVGNKSNETEKVFNFLFDSTDVANAIANCNIDLNTMNQELEVLSADLIYKRSELQRENILYDIYVFKYYYFLINDYITTSKQLEHLKHRKVRLENLIDDTSALCAIYIGSTNIDNLQNVLSGLQNNHLNSKLVIVNDLISFLSIVNNVNKYIIDYNNYVLLTLKESNIIAEINQYQIQIDSIAKIDIINSEIDAYKYYIKSISDYQYNILYLERLNNSSNNKKLEIINSLISDTNGLNILNQQLLKYDESNDSVFALNQNKFEFETSLTTLSDECGVQECSCCNALGYIIKD